MPRSSTVLQVFVASPSDVAEERTTLDAVIAELNRTWAGSLRISFDVWKWETHARPGFSADAQAVINAQVPDDYDVFIGILWARLGTPTGRAISGTVEEFERAYARFKATGSVPEIMMYFKDAPLAPSKIDSDQFAALQTFRNSLPEKGGFYSTFEDQARFEASLRTHLTAIAQKFVGIANSENPPPLRSDPRDVLAIVDEDENGLLDYIDIYSTRAQDMNAALDVITEATGRVGEQLSLRSSEWPTHVVGDAGQVKRLAKRASEDMFRYADTLGLQVTVLSSARQEAFAALSSAVALMTDFQSDQDQLQSLRKTLQETIAGGKSARSSLLGMRQAANGLPRVSKDINQSKRAVTENLDRFLSEIESIESTVTNIIDAMDRLLASSDPGIPNALSGGALPSSETHSFQP